MAPGLSDNVRLAKSNVFVNYTVAGIELISHTRPLTLAIDIAFI